MSRLPILVVLACLAAAPAAHAQGPANPLVYVVVLDGLDGDAVDQGKAPYIASLLRGEQGARSTYFRESRSIMVAETNPNHAAMATGAYGDASGIPGNSFAVYGAIADDDSCPTGPLDESLPPSTTSGESAACLVAESFFETVQRGAGADALLTAGIFGKPKLARIFAGRKADPSRYDADYLWTPCGNGSDADYCKPVPSRPNDAYSLFDSDVMDELLRTVRDGVPGDGKTFSGGNRRPDLTFVNLPGIDAAGHGTGRGAAYDQTAGLADGQVQRFVEQQKQLGLWQRSVLILLSDHSMESTPDKSSLTARFTAAGIPSGDYKVVQNGSAAFVYVSDRQDPGRFALLKQLRAAALGDSVVPFAGPPAVEALYREPNPQDGGAANTVAAAHPAWRLAAGARTGDLVITARPNGAFNEPNPLPGNHGGPQTRDNFLAVIGGSPLVNQRSLAGTHDALFDDTLANPQQAENVDVAPTAMRLLGRPAPAQSAGRFLTEAFDPALLPAAVAASPAGACGSRIGSASFRAIPRGRGLRFALAGLGSGRARVDVFQASIGRRILGNRRIARFKGRSRSFAWSGRRARDGQLFARFSLGKDVQRVALERRRGRFRLRPAFARSGSCAAVASFKLERPVFGGRTNRSLDVSYRLAQAGRARLELLRGSRVVRRLARDRTQEAGRTYRVRLASERLARGAYRVRLTVDGGATTLTARRL